MLNSSEDVASYGGSSVEIYPPDPVPLKVLQLVEFTFCCLLINVFALLGLAGATINIIVLTSYNITTDSSNILLISLSVADFIFCLTIPFCRSKCIVSHLIDYPTAIIVDVFVTEHLAFFNRVFYYISITLVGTISAERFLVVFFPLRIVSILTPLRVKLLACAVYVLNFALASPGFLCLDHNWIFWEIYNRSLPVLTFTEFYRDNFDAVNVEILLVYNISVLSVSIILTLTLTPAIAVKLWMVTLKRQKLIQKKCSFDLQVAKILMAVCTVSLLVYGPFVCYITIKYFTPGYTIISNSFQLYMIITDFSGTIGASVNFIIYVTMSNKFRKHYKELVSKLLPKCI